MNQPALKPCQQGVAVLPPFGVLLVNLGSPDAPSAAAVRRFLKEFLSDPRVVDLPRWLWWPLLNGVILNIRSKPVARLYQKIWMQDAPLRLYTQRQAQALTTQLAQHYGQPIPVAVGMTYGNPSLSSGLLELRRAGINRVVVLPLYPQFSCSTTASVFDRVTKALRRCRQLPEVRYVPAYYDNESYITALAESVLQHWQLRERSAHLLMSFHGLPQRFVDQGDPYSLQCEITAQRLADRLGLTKEQWSFSYQSRFGREPWLLPATDSSLCKLAQHGVTTVDVICPGFASDCLETLEEIALRSAEQFYAEGGQNLCYIPALNDAPLHIGMMQALVSEQSTGWAMATLADSPVKSGPASR